MKYADVADVEAGFRPLDAEEQKLCDDLLDEAGIPEEERDGLR